MARGPQYALADMILGSRRLPPQAVVIMVFSQRPGKTERDGLISQNRHVRAYRYNDVSARRRFFLFCRRADRFVVSDTRDSRDVGRGDGRGIDNGERNGDQAAGLRLRPTNASHNETYYFSPAAHPAQWPEQRQSSSATGCHLSAAWMHLPVRSFTSSGFCRSVECAPDRFTIPASAP